MLQQFEWARHSMEENDRWSFNPMGLLAGSARGNQRFYCQRFNVNVTDLICSSFCWEKWL